jgi:Protein of unknown function (DUF2865)
LVTIASLDRAGSDESVSGFFMIRILRGFGGVTLTAIALCASAAAQTPGPPPPQSAPQKPPSSDAVCVRLESQLAVLDRGAANSARADQIRRYEDSVAKQQADLDRAQAQSRKYGCEGIGGFFSLFTGTSPQCGPLNSQIQQMRGNLDRLMSDLEQLKSNNNDQQGPRRALISQLAQNNCGPQYRAAAAAQGQGGFLDAIFGGTVINPGGDGAPSGTYRTLCVRTCDGFYFPISYSTVPTHFAEDQLSCQRLCPASEAVLYSYHNPGEDVNQAVSPSGHLYTELPNAFLYRRQIVAGCSCRRPGQSWADALKGADDSSTLERGDIVVNEQNAKALSQPPAPRGAPGKPGGTPAAAAGEGTSTAAAQPPANAPTDSSSQGVRVVGPPFIASH